LTAAGLFPRVQCAIKRVRRTVKSTTHTHTHNCRLTGKRTTPHLVRDMIVTHLRGGDASEKELEALAIYMGHSIAMQVCEACD
jgi:hypothetical protein